MKNTFRGGLAIGSLGWTLVLTAHAAPPVISYQPQSQNVLLYQQAAFGVTAAGTEPFSYQWLKNGASIPGATNDELTVAHARLADEGQYSVVVSNNQGMATTSNAELTVRLPGSGDIDFSFGHEGIIGAGIHKIVVLPDGRVLVGGQLTDHGPIARLQANGEVDGVFMSGVPNFNEPYLMATVYDIVPQADGRVIISGNFLHSNGTNETYIARLNPDGTLDPSFSNTLEASYGLEILTMLPMGGKLLVGGAFYENTNTSSVNLARINSDGSVDPSFQVPVEGIVHALAAQSNGQVLVGGYMYSAGGINCTNLVRLNADGTLDTNFSAAIVNDYGYDIHPPVASLAIQSDGKILVAGSFTEVNGVARTNLARLNADGSLDESFNPDPVLATYGVWAINCITIQGDGKIFVGSTPNWTNSNLCVRLNSDGSLDNSFRCSVDNEVLAITLDRDGKILIGGNFHAVDGVVVMGMARLNGDGTLDAQFPQPLPALVNGPVYSVTAQDKDKILIGGSFTEVNGEAKPFLARLHSDDGSLDTGFSAEPAGLVTRIAIQGDGKIVIAGSFTNVNGISRHGIARLLSDGSLDSTFQNGLEGIAVPYDGSGQDLSYNHVTELAIQSDSHILVAGDFSQVNGVPCANMARFNPDGTLDATFKLGVSMDPTYSWIDSIALQPDGKILIGGHFYVGNSTQGGMSGIARLNADGTFDDSFHVSATAFTEFERDTHYPVPPTIWSIGLQSDGKIIMAGSFEEIGTETHRWLARLLPDGTFDRDYPVTSAYLIHMLPDDSFFTAGTVISKFDSNGMLVTNFSNSVSADNYAGNFARGEIEMDYQGKVLVAGGFTKMNGAAFPYLARLWGSDHPPVLIPPTVGATDVNLTWHAISNRTYRVQYTENLSTNVWHDLPGDVCATNDLAGKTDMTASTAVQRYYRLQQLP